MKDAMKRINRETTDWEKTFTRHISIWDRYPTHIKNPENSVIKKTTQLETVQKTRTDTSIKKMIHM